MSEQITLRDELEASINSVENGQFNKVEDAPPLSSQEDNQSLESRTRDEKGRFSSPEKNSTEVKNTADVKSGNDQIKEEVKESETKSAISRPTTWKKEYLPIWDKLTSGQPLTSEEAIKLAEYSNQREKEFANGVSTYRTEAQNAKALQEAIAPFVPVLQQNNIEPTQWIKNLGNAHYALATGTPEQKLEMFKKLADDYGVPLGAVGQAGNLDPVVPQLMQYIQNLESKVNTVAGWKELQEQQAIQNELSRFSDANKYPHFESVRGIMAQLLESGVAQDLDSAYSKAIRLNDDVWNAEQERMATALAEKQAASEKANAIVQAKNRAVSTKTSTPSGSVMTADKKDLRSKLSQEFDNLLGGRV